jgi:serine protease inhibitor
MEHYYLTMMDQLLIADDENTVISPLNTYIAFAMLAELSDGNTRRQLLDLLGAPDIETLRADVSTLWNGNYVDTPILKSILANSLWLNDTVNYKAAALDTLAKDYYASSFYGDPSTPEMSEALRNWTDQNTGGILGEYVKDMELDPSTVLSIVSTIYYKAMWYDEFNASENTRESFHGTMGDTAVDMMHRSDINEVYRTDAFTAIHLGLNDSGSMYFFLPKEGVDVNSLLTDPDTIKATRTEYMTDDENASTAMVNMSIPKFSISNNSDLTQALKNCGISDIFDPLSSDFSPLTDDRNELYVSKAEHTALVEIDEQGVSGAAFTRVDLSGGAMLPEEEIDLVLDRPFMFMICGRDGSILFAGIVRNIT